MSTSTKLAAIMFTDIVGYTALMGNREDEAMALLETNRKLQKPLIEEHQGLLLKEIGDGMLISFSTATSAMKCALSIQEAAKKQGELQLRIGIHVGEVVFSEGDVFGDGVNIASRLEPMSLPGGITVSDSVHRNIKNKIELVWEELGEKDLKNVDDSIRIYRYHPDNPNNTRKPRNTRWRTWHIVIAIILLMLIGLSALLWYTKNQKLTSAAETSLATSPSIAVLPFVDMSATGDQEYLGDGIAEEIINALTKIQDLKVIGRTSSFSFKEQNVDLRDIGIQLNVGTVLEGSVQKAGDQIRITAQLINTQDGSHLWSERYDRKLDDIFRIQDDIATRIAEKFKLTLSLHTGDSPPTRNLDAYELYLKGLQNSGLGLAGVEAAAEFFEQALQLDPQFVSAYSELAFANWQIGFYGLGERAKHYSIARKMALRAIELAPKSYLGYTQLGLLDLLVDWNWKASKENFQKAIDLGLPLPNYLECAYEFWVYGVDAKLIEEARVLLEKDPLSPTMQANMTRTLLYARRFEETIRHGEQFLKFDPKNTSILRHVGEGHLFSGNPELALPYFKTLIKKDPTYVPHDYIATLMALGRQKEARTFFNLHRDSIMLGRLALCYIHLGELDNALATMEQAYLDGDTWIYMKWDMHYDPVREDPRYQAILKKMNFPEDQ